MPSALTVEHRQAIENLSNVTRRQLARFIPTDGSPDRIRDALLDVVPAFGDAYGEAAASLGADYYDEMRFRAGVDGRFDAVLADPVDLDRYDALVRWGVEPLYQPSPDIALAVSKVGGGLQKIVAQQARQTVANSSQADPAASGWRRVLESEACAFCRMLADRGAVYTDSSVRFASHDDCNCAAEPAFEPGRSVSTVAYVASQKTITEADRARVRAFLSANY